MIVETSEAERGCTMQDGANLLFPSKYEASLALYALCDGKLTRSEGRLVVKTVHCGLLE